MEYSINQKIDFGQYKGLTIKQIWQGTLNIDSTLLKDFLHYILTYPKFYEHYCIEFQFIEHCEVTEKHIKIVWEIDNPNKPLSDKNRMYLGNMQQKLENYINNHFENNWLGILKNIQSFNSEQDEIKVIGGDSDYLKWCLKTVDSFVLSKQCIKKLNETPTADLQGFKLLYTGGSIHEYTPYFNIHQNKI